MNNLHYFGIIRHLLPLMVSAVLLAAVASGCRSVKPAGMAASGIELAGASPEMRLDRLVATYEPWTYVSMPVRLSITSPKPFSVTAQCEMKRNSWVQFSVRMLGFEVAKVWIDNDSIHAVDKYHRRYLSESMRRFLGSNDVTVGNLQDIMLGRAFITGESGGTLSRELEAKISFMPSPQGLMLLPAVEPNDFNYGFILDNEADNVAAASVTVGQAYAMVATYSRFYNTPAGAVTSAASVQTVKGPPVDFSLTWNLQSAKWNRDESRSWSAPSGYTKIPSSQILQLFSGF